MNPENQQNPQNPFQPQQNTAFPPEGHNAFPAPLPNATTILVLGIVSIVTACCCYGIVGVIIGAIALSMAGKARHLYQSNPGAYAPSTMSTVNTGRICAIIGLVIGVLAVIAYVAVIAMYGVEVLTNPEMLRDIMQGA